MKINFSIEIEDLEGNPIPKSETNKTNATVGSCCINALMASYEDEKGLSGDDKVKRLNLAQKIHSDKSEYEYTAEDVVLLKKLVGKAYAPLVVGRVYEVLEV